MNEDKELEKEIERYFEGWYFDEELDIMNYSSSFDDIKEIARYFANWSKERMIKNSIPAYQETNKYGNKQLHSWSGLCELDELEEGEEVKIAIIK